MNTVLEISPRNLGLTMLQTFCPLCFWILIRMRFHPPFDHGGGALWTYMQQIQEAQIGNHLKKNGCLPKEFSPFCSIKSRTEFPKHWSKFRYEHKSGVILYGIPDEIFTLADGSQCVIDHKTATKLRRATRQTYATSSSSVPLPRKEVRGLSYAFLGQMSTPICRAMSPDHSGNPTIAPTRLTHST